MGRQASTARPDAVRVLWFSNHPSPVGRAGFVGEGWVNSLQRVLRDQRDIEVILAVRGETDRVERLSEDCIVLPGFPPGGRARQWLVDVSCRLEPGRWLGYADRAIELVQPDLIQVWGTEHFYGLIAGQCAPPVLIHIQGLRNPYSAAYCLGLSKFDLLRFGSRKHLVSGRSLLHTYYRYRRSAQREKAILGGARFLAGRTHWDRLATTALAPAATYFHCDEVLRPAFYEATWTDPPRNGAARIVTTVRGNAYKGVETVAECAGILRDLGLEFSWSLVGIRPGEEIHRIVERKLRVRFSDLGLELLGRQPEQGVLSQLLASHVYVQPSWIENSPNGFCEALLLGMPTVSTHVGGVGSLVGHGQDTLLVPPGDPWAMAGAIQTLLSDRDTAKQLGSNARAAAQRRHDPEAIVETVCSIYSQILNAEGR